MHTSTRDAITPSSRTTTRAFAALLLGLLMAQLDTTVVVAALPGITSDLESGGAAAGIAAVYLLTVTLSTPVHGKLGDMLGRRTVFHGALAPFAVGSLGCAAAPSLPALVAARGVQGIGGGLVVTAVSAMAQMFTRDEMVRRQGHLASVFALSALAGPPLGGILADGPGWRWIFLVNLPLCAVAALLAARGLPTKPQDRPATSFDWAGTVLITAVGGGVVAVGSSDALARSGTATAAVFAVVAGCTVAFIRTERRAAAPLIPPSLFRDRAVARGIATTGLAGVSLFGGFTFIPLAVRQGTGVGDGAPVCSCSR